MTETIVTRIAIAFDTKQGEPGHSRSRIGPPLLIQEADIPEELLEKILALAQEHAERYWGMKEAK